MVDMLTKTYKSKEGNLYIILFLNKLINKLVISKAVL